MEVYETKCPWEVAPSLGPIEYCCDGRIRELRRHQEHGGRHFRGEQALGRAFGRPRKNVQGHAEDLAGREELPSCAQESRGSRDARDGTKTLWRRQRRS